MLFGEGPHGPDLLLTARASTLRSHAGQPAFPGGSRTARGRRQDGAAGRREETGSGPGFRAAGGAAARLFLESPGSWSRPCSRYWREPGPVAPVDLAETAAVARVPVPQLADPGNRGRVRHPSGYVGPAFEVADMVVWGFTAGLVDVLLDLGGWTVPWDRQRYIALPELG